MPLAPDTGSGVLEWITALGTLAAVLVALGLGVGPSLYRWLMRPKLRVVIGRVEPYVRLHRENMQFGHVTLRAGVRNDGRSEALRARVRVENWWRHEPMPAGHPDWRRKDLDPAALHWGALAPAHRRETPPEIGILPGAIEYFDLVRFYAKGISELLLDEGRLDPGHDIYRDYEREATYRIEVVVASENAASISYIISYRLRDNMFDEIRFEERPPIDLPTGTLALLELVQKEQRLKESPGDEPPASAP